LGSGSGEPVDSLTLVRENVAPAPKDTGSPYEILRRTTRAGKSLAALCPVNDGMLPGAVSQLARFDHRSYAVIASRGLNEEAQN
jgi:hypothetical protein